MSLPFLEKFPYKVGDKVKDARIEDYVGTIIKAQWDNYEEEVVYTVIWDDMNELSYFAKDLQPYKEETVEETVMLLGWAVESKGKRLIPHKGYEIKQDGKEFYLVKKKPQYPKTYAECCEVLDYEPEEDTERGYNSDLIEDFQKLKLCRDAYWKLTGWEPDWASPELKYVIKTIGNKVCLTTECTINCILAFPTEEMRDAFYENFKYLIEACKDLL